MKADRSRCQPYPADVSLQPQADSFPGRARHPNAVINDTARMLKRLIGEDIELLVSPAAESLWAIEADPDQIVQVLMNLCVNARDAMPQGGTLTIATGNVTVDKASVDATLPVAGRLCVAFGRRHRNGHQPGTC